MPVSLYCRHNSLEFSSLFSNRHVGSRDLDPYRGNRNTKERESPVYRLGATESTSDASVVTQRARQAALATASNWLWNFLIACKCTAERVLSAEPQIEVSLFESPSLHTIHHSGHRLRIWFRFRKSDYLGCRATNMTLPSGGMQLGRR
jgi:hypothetical protein